MYRQSYNAKLCPLLRLFSPNKDCAAENKVNTHTDCHSDNTHIKPKSEQSREEKPCGNCKKNRYNHGKFYIACCTKSVTKRTGKRICQAVEDIIDQYKNYNKFFCLRRDSGNSDYERRNHENQSVPQNGQHKGNFI